MLRGWRIEAGGGDPLVHLPVAVEGLGDEHGQTLGGEDPGDLPDDVLGVRQVVEAERRDDDIARPVGQREFVEVAFDELHLAVGQVLGALAGLGEQRGGGVQAHDALGPELLG